MNFDFSHLYKTETVLVKGHSGETLFEVVVREITHGEKTAAQNQVLGAIELPTEGNKRKREQFMKAQMQAVDKASLAAKVALMQEVAGIVSWTLQDASGKAVPVCLEAWKALPAFMTDQIVEAIERLNPDFDDEFPADSGGPDSQPQGHELYHTNGME